MNKTTDLTVDLLEHYVFDLGGCTASELIERWLKGYSATWVRLAVVEALYRGRYKAVSVEQILSFWQRRGQVLYHFNHEFERLVCSSFLQSAGQFKPDNASLLVSEKTVGSHSDKHRASRLLKSDNSCSIEQFIPETDQGSDFYSKLKAIAQSPEG